MVSDSSHERPDPGAFWLIAGSTAVGVVLLASAYFTFSYAPSARREAVSQISQVLTLRVHERALAIETWLDERFRDARLVAVFPATAQVAVQESPGVADVQHLQQILALITSFEAWDHAYVFGPDLVLKATASTDAPVDAAVVQGARRALDDSTESVSLARIRDGSNVLVFSAPVVHHRRKRGAVVLVADPTDWLHPTLLLPPTDHRSAEFVLMRLEGDSLEILAPTAHGSPAARGSSRRFGGSGLDTVAGPIGRGFAAFTDYGGVAVYGAGLRLRRTGWLLVAKIPRGEALATHTQQLRRAAITGALLVLALGGVMVVVWRNQVLRMDLLAARTRQRLAQVLDHANDAMLFVSRDGTVLDANRRAQELYGAEAGKPIGLTAAELRSERARDVSPPDPDRLFREGAAVYETEHLRADGSTVPVEVSTRLVRVEGEAQFVSVVRDLSERKASERRIQRLNQLLRFRSAVNRLMAEAPDADDLFEGVCRHAADVGLPLVWIGRIEPGGRVTPVALAGRAKGYLTEAEIRWDDSELGRGPVGQAISEERLVSVRDVSHDPHCVPWRAAARASGLVSSAVAPIRRGGRTGFTLHVYATEPGAFEGENAELIEELARDVEHGLQSADDRVARRRAEVAFHESERRFRQIVEASVEGIGLLDAEGRVAYTNTHLALLMGRTPEAVLGKPMVDLVAVEGREDLLRHLAGESESGGSRVFDCPLQTATGGVAWTLASMSLLADDTGGRTGALVMFADIRARKEAEAALRTLTAELEGRVLERTAELEAANKELEAFSYSVSHDLRAPLRAVDGFVKVLVDEHSGALNAEALRLMEVVRSNTTRMGQLIDDLLTLSRAGRHELRRDRIDMDDLLREVLVELGRDQPAHRPEFVVGACPAALGDPTLIRQVWVNLIANAVKFSAPRDAPRVEIDGRAEGGRVVYTVRDNGVGFDMRYAGKLFGVFQRLHSVREFEGTGVGLALTKRIVERHGGTVWGEGTPGAGAVFRFTLPPAESG